MNRGERRVVDAYDACFHSAITRSQPESSYHGTPLGSGAAAEPLELRIWGHVKSRPAPAAKLVRVALD